MGSSDTGSTCAACAQSLPALDYAFCPYCGAATGVTESPRPPARPLTRPRLDVAKRPSQHRVVSVMFADVCGFTGMSDTLEPEVLTHMLNRLFAHMSAVVTRYDGFVDKFIGDAALILFGAPMAHEDDAVRAVRTAGDLLKALSAVNAECAREYGVNPTFQLHVGIATGRVVTGWVGTADRGGYTAIGPTVNLASRLCDASTRMQVAVCDQTAHLVRGTWATRVRPATIEGQERPLHQVVFDGDQEVTLPPRATFVGREGELEQLSTRLQSLVRDGQGGVMVVGGNAGMGKTRLVHEALERLGEQAFDVDMATASPFGTTSPFDLLLPLISRWLEQATERGEATVDGIGWLQKLADGRIESRPVSGAEQFREQAFGAVLSLLEQAMAGRPRLLVLDDVQFADATSWALLGRLRAMSERMPLLLLLVGRSHLEVAGAEAIRVKPLSDEATDTLVSAVATLSDERRARVVEHSGGIPLYAEELALHALANPDDTALAPTIHSLVAARLDQLPPQARVRLELASVFMRFFEPQLVDRLAGLPFDPEAWDELETAGEVVREHLGGDRVEYRLGHPMAREVLYSTMLRQRRRQLHGRIAEALETDGGIAPRHALGWHYEQAGESDKAASHWLAAARQAVGLFANIEALNLFEKAGELAEDFTVAAEAGVEQAQLLRRLGRLSEAASLLERLGEEAMGRGDLAATSRTYAERANVAYWQGDGEAIGRHAELALRAARDVGDAKLVAAALRQVGIAHEFAGRYGPAERAYREVLAQERDLLTSAYLIGVYNSLGEIARQSARPDVALMWYDKSQRVFERTRGEEVNVIGLANRGAALVALGQHEEAQVSLRKALAEHERTGYLAFQSEPLCYLARSLAETGDLEGGMGHAAEALLLARDHGESEIEALAMRTLGELLEAGAELDQALAESGTVSHDGVEALSASVAMFEANGKRIELAHSRVALAEMLAKRGDQEGARTSYQAAAKDYGALDQQVLAAKVNAAVAQLRASDSSSRFGSR